MKYISILEIKMAKKKHNPRKGPPFTPGKDVPLKPDPDPDTTEHEGDDPEKNDPTRIEDPDIIDPTRIVPEIDEPGHKERKDIFH